MCCEASHELREESYWRIAGRPGGPAATLRDERPSRTPWQRTTSCKGPALRVAWFSRYVRRMEKPRRLKRSADRVFAGVCGGIAEFIDWEPRTVRILYALASFFSAAFPGILVYVILWWVMPEDDGESFRLEDYHKQ